MAPASRHLAAFGGVSRPAGSAAAATARAYCAGILGAAGFVTTEVEFEYSKFTGAWAAPTAGVVIPAIGTLLVLARGSPAGMLAAGALLLAAAATLGWIGTRGVLALPLLRARGMNLEATRGESSPAVWLVAHIDSKWQPVSMVMRIAGVVVSSTALIALAVAVFVRPDIAGALLTVQWIGALPLILSVVGAHNHGTLDNASGVATVLEAAELLPRDANIGVLITDAEELALAGARAWVRGKAGGIALNVDSIDDDGRFVLMYSGSKPAQLVAAFDRAASWLGESVRPIRLLPGVLTDHVPLAQSGWTTLTLSRGTVRTLGRIHTARDTLANMDGRAIASAARILARTATELS